MEKIACLSGLCFLFFPPLRSFCSWQRDEYVTSVVSNRTKRRPKNFFPTPFLSHGVFLGMQLPNGEADILAGVGDPSKGVLPVLYWAEFGGEGQGCVKCGHHFLHSFLDPSGQQGLLAVFTLFCRVIGFVISLV